VTNVVTLVHLSRTELILPAVPEIMVFIPLARTKLARLARTEITALVHPPVTEVVTLVRMAETVIAALVHPAVTNVITLVHVFRTELLRPVVAKIMVLVCLKKTSWFF
jgi:hypothetical protein